MLQPITAELSDVPAEVVHDVAWKQPKTCGLDASLAVHQLPTLPLVSWQCLGFHKISGMYPAGCWVKITFAVAKPKTQTLLSRVQ